MSERDRTLLRIEKLLDRQFILPPPGQEKDPEPNPPDLVDLEAIVEIAQLPPPPAVKLEAESQPPPPEDGSRAEEDGPREAADPKTPLWLQLVQAGILLFVMTWVFIFGILVGRGHLWESGPGHDLVVWLEETAGWGPKQDPQVVLRPEENSGRPGEEAAEKEPLYRDFYSPAPPSSSGPAFDAPAGLPPAVPERPADGGLAAVFGEPGPAGEDLAAVAARSWAGSQWFEQDARQRQEEMMLARSGLGEEEAEPENLESADSPPPARPAVPADSSEGRFAVQVALVYDESEARNRIERLARQGFTAYYYKNPNGRLPVRVGHFNSRREAEEARDQLRQLGYANPYISKVSD